MAGIPGWYDDWKTACCGQWPNCNNCPYDVDENSSESEEEYNDEE